MANTKDSMIITLLGFPWAILFHIIMAKATQKRNLMQAASVKIDQDF